MFQAMVSNPFFDRLLDFRAAAVSVARDVIVQSLCLCETQCSGAVEQQILLPQHQNYTVD